MKYQVFFIGVRAFVWSPVFAKVQSAQNWLARNRHRVVEDLQIIEYDKDDRTKTKWMSETLGKYDGWQANPYFQKQYPPF